MPSSLAALLTLLFIGWAFYSTSKREAGFSRGLWIPTTWICIYGSRMVSYWISGEGASSPDGSPLDRNIFLVLILLGIRVLICNRPAWNVITRDNRWLLLYIAFCGVSVVWADYSFVAFKRWVKEVGTLIMVLIIATDGDPINAARKVFLRGAYILVPLSVLLSKYYVEMGRTYDEWTGEPMICGVATDKNGLGRLCFVSILFVLSSMVEGKPRQGWLLGMKRQLPKVAVLGMCGWLLLQAESSTSKGCVAVGLVVFVLARLHAFRHWRHITGITTLALVAASFMVLTIPSVRTVFAQALGRRGDLTDRTRIWEGAFALETNPVIGSGYGSVWLTQRGMHLKEQLKMAHSHNGFLESYLNTGLIGLFLLVMVVAVAGANAVKAVNCGVDGGPLLIAIFLSCTIYNYTEVGFGNISLVGVLMWLLAVRTRRGSGPNGIVPDTLHASAGAGHEDSRTQWSDEPWGSHDLRDGRPRWHRRLGFGTQWSLLSQAAQTNGCRSC